MRNKEYLSFLVFSLLIISFYVIRVYTVHESLSDFFAIKPLYAYHDVHLKDLSYYYINAASWIDLKIRFWESETYLGHPYIANPETAFYYYPNIILSMIGREHMMLLSLPFHAIVFCTGLFLLIRLFSIDRTSSLIASLILVFSGTYISLHEHPNVFTCFSWAPLLAYFVYRIIYCGASAVIMLFSALVFVFALNAGSPPTIFFLLLTVLGFASLGLIESLSRKKFNKTDVWRIAGFVLLIIPVLIAGSLVFYGPVLELLPFSSRGKSSQSHNEFFFTMFSDMVAHLFNVGPIQLQVGRLDEAVSGKEISLLSLGYLPLFLAIFSFQKKRWNSLFLFLLFAFIIAVCLSFQFPWFRSIWTGLPGMFVSLIRTTQRIMLPGLVFLAIPAARGVMRIRAAVRLSRSRSIVWRWMASRALAGVLPLLVFYNKANLIFISVLIVIAGILYLTRRGKYYGIIGQTLIPGILILYAFFRIDFNAIHPAINAKHFQLYDREIENIQLEYPHDRFYLLHSRMDKASCIRCLALKGISQAEDYHVPGLLRTNLLFSEVAGHTEKPGDQQLRSDFGLDPFFAHPYNSDSVARIFRLLSIKYIIVISPRESLRRVLREYSDLEFSAEQAAFLPVMPDLGSNYKLVQSNGVDVYELKGALPREYLVGNRIVLRDESRIKEVLFSPDFAIDETIILEDESSPEASPNCKGEVNIIKLEDNQAIYNVTNSSECYFVVNDTYYPGWSATVDGKPVKIYRSNYIFRSVYLPPGAHIVALSFRPNNFNIYVLISFCSAIIATLIFIWLRRYYL